MQTLMPDESESVREGAELMRAFVAFLRDPKHSLRARAAVVTHAAWRLVAARQQLLDECSAPVHSARTH
jgi:hypothetical protein